MISPRWVADLAIAVLTTVALTCLVELSLEGTSLEETSLRGTGLQGTSPVVARATPHSSLSHSVTGPATRRQAAAAPAVRSAHG